MKRIGLLLVILASLSFLQEASAQKHRFYYYPASNVYYNPVTNQYIYPFNGRWTTVTKLPSGYAAKGSRVIVYSQSMDVWQQNSAHQSKYRTTPAPKGKAVGYKGTNPNKAQGRTRVEVTGKNAGRDAENSAGKSKGKVKGKG